MAVLSRRFLFLVSDHGSEELCSYASLLDGAGMPQACVVTSGCLDFQLGPCIGSSLSKVPTLQGPVANWRMKILSRKRGGSREVETARSHNFPCTILP